MDKKLTYVSTTEMSRQDWLNYRYSGIGASEVSTIMGLNPYKSSLELFHEKIGTGSGLNVETMAMFMGKEMESFIAKMWEYWPGDVEGMIQNYRNEAKVRRMQRVNAYVRNPKFPWLFVSLDRKINKTDTSPEGALEIKTISGYEADKWQAGVPVGHVVQIQTQLVVCGFPFGELATLKDGRHFDVLPFEANKNIQKAIVDKTRDFWDRVLKGRIVNANAIEAQRTFNMKKVQDLQAELMALEPEPDGTDAYADYLKERYNIDNGGEKKAGPVLYDHALKHILAHQAKKSVEEQIRLHENVLKAEMGDFQKLVFPNGSFVSWKTTENGARRFVNKVQ